MLYPIEIKVNIEGDVGAALEALGHPVPATKRLVWFAEDGEGIAKGELRLFSGGVIIRIRSGEGPDDSTVKLRPCVVGDLPERWKKSPAGAPPFEYRIESDWSGRRHVHAASAVVGHPQSTLLQRGDGAALTPGSITADQLTFLRDCTSTPVDTDRLVALGSIASTKWEDVEVGSLKVNAERWQVGGEDFLEVSDRIKPKDDDSAGDLAARAQERQKELTAALADLRISESANEQSKTQRVLTALANSALANR